MLRLVIEDLEPHHLDEWAQWMEGRGMSPRTIDERLRILRQIAHETGVQPLTLTQPDISLWLAQFSRSTATRSTYFAALRAWFRWLTLTGQRLDDPTRLVGAPRTPPRHPRPADDRQIDAVLASDIRFLTRVKIELAMYQGLRAAEISAVSGRDVDLITGTLRVVGKGSKTAYLPLHETIGRRARVLPRGTGSQPAPAALGT